VERAVEENIENIFNALGAAAVSGGEGEKESRPQRRRNGVGVDRETFGRLVLEHLPAAQRFAIRLCGDADAGEEIAAEALLKAAKSWKSYRGEAKFKTWLFAIVINAFRDWMRGASSDAQLPVEIVDVRSAVAGERMEAEELGVAVAKMIGMLPARQREVLVLSVYEEMNSIEIAEMLGISQQNVRTNLHLGREKLRALLAPFVNESEI
jgi:RNA polymerase sigma-70 factor (ECF subfamily)